MIDADDMEPYAAAGLKTAAIALAAIVVVCLAVGYWFGSDETPQVAPERLVTTSDAQAAQDWTNARLRDTERRIERLFERVERIEAVVVAPFPDPASATTPGPIERPAGEQSIVVERSTVRPHLQSVPGCGSGVGGPYRLAPDSAAR